MFEDYEDEEQELKPARPVCPINAIDLGRLAGVTMTTKNGLVDKGFPSTMMRLAAQGYVKLVGDGYQATPEGFALVKQWRRKLK